MEICELLWIKKKKTINDNEKIFKIPIKFFLLDNNINKKIAVEHNGAIISKINYKKKYLKNDDKVEIVHFIGGG